MSYRLPAVGGTFIQMEDEIASLGAVIGASLAGVKAMTATSGPGFSLMQENLGFACMAEVPCVIVNVMRGGPSTGLPTRVSQGDVMQARWGTHGDHPIIVLSPTSVSQSFDLTVKAFNFSERYRTPVILLLDEIIGHMREKIDMPSFDRVERMERIATDVPAEWYRPYGDSLSDVPPMANFGEGYRYHITGLFHDPLGYPTQRLDEIDPWIHRVHRKIERNMDDIVLFDAVMTGDAPSIAPATLAGLRLGNLGRHQRQLFDTVAERDQLGIGARHIGLWQRHRRNRIARRGR
jgi:2-oxoglutarate ferredoxin oxidoreductase subunit alpha